MSLVLFLGAMSVALVYLVTPLLENPVGVPVQVDLWYAGVFVILAAVGELAYVRVRHGDADEDLTFLEAVLVAAALTMPPLTAMATVLAGLLLASIIVRRDAPKTLFNLGSYAASTGAMILIYRLLDHGEPRFSLESALSLSVATITFAMINTALLSLVFHVVVGVPPRKFLHDEWQLSVFMAVGGVGIGMTAVALADSAPALTPFVVLPILALWYAYGEAAVHAQERERNRWLVQVGSAVAKHGSGVDVLDDASTSIAQVFGAPEHIVLSPLDAGTAPAQARLLASLDDVAAPRPLGPDELPAGWRNGVVTMLDVGADRPGALLLGSSTEYRRGLLPGRARGWTLSDADGPVLGALVAALGSSLRAGATFDSLAEETAKLSAVVDNTSDGIAMVDDEGAVRLWSQTMARMTGVDAAGVGDPIEAAPEIVRALVDASRASGEGSVPVHLVREDGEELDVTVSTVRVREATASAGDDSSGWVSILTVHDETRERRVERMKTDFVATISHELRTPITPIKGYAHLLVTRGDRMTPEKRLQVLQTITDNANHLDRLVEDLLMASRVSGGARLAIQMEMHDLADIVNRAVASFPNMAARITVTMPDEPIEVQCDPTRAVQCLTNLIGNAHKYAPGDSPIDVTVVRAGLHARVHVRDHGAGIPVSEHDKVFERFFRREDPFTMRTGGAGLGLHIAREFAVAMGGGLTLQSPESGTGAEFVLHLLTSEAPPVAGVHLAKDQPKPEPGMPPPGFVAGKGRVDTPPTRHDQPVTAVPAGTMDPPTEPGSHAAAGEPAPANPVDEAPATADAAMEVA